MFVFCRDAFKNSSQSLSDSDIHIINLSYTAWNAGISEFTIQLQAHPTHPHKNTLISESLSVSWRKNWYCSIFFSFFLLFILFKMYFTTSSPGQSYPASVLSSFLSLKVHLMTVSCEPASLSACFECALHSWELFLVFAFVFAPCPDCYFG